MNSNSSLQAGRGEADAALIEELKISLDAGRQNNAAHVSDCALRLLNGLTKRSFASNAELINRACYFLFEVGQSTRGIVLGSRIAAQAECFGDVAARRRICNILGIQYADIADFPAAMQQLETAVLLSREIGDKTLEAACLANVLGVLTEMGHYRQAIEMANRVLRLNDDSQIARNLKIQAASNGLFAAHRVGQSSAAQRFLEIGQVFLGADTDPLRRAFFERGRALFLIDLGEASRAREFLDEVIALTKSVSTPRIEILLAIASAICDWALGNIQGGRARLSSLHHESKSSRLYHHFVLQALIKVYSNASTPAEAEMGMIYARELVEYTTSVKKAKFYRQLACRREIADKCGASSNATSLIDPFSAIRDWMRASDIKAPPEDETEKRELAKHEELTAIHEDMAKLRAQSIRRDIRTDAVDTAENWAIAAEFFDDETGQHCFRVGHLAAMLAKEINLDETFCVRIEHAARLHDIGKIAINEVILLKPGPLDAAEMAAMRLHTEVGAQILSGSDDPVLKMATEVARHHHEWWNGTGYPTKRSGKNIPLSARLCAYADVYDALTHMRAYKKAWSHERAVEEIVRLNGTQFDPDLLDPFLSVLDRYRTDLAAGAIQGFVDMESNSLIASRKKLMETISA